MKISGTLAATIVAALILGALTTYLIEPRQSTATVTTSFTTTITTTLSPTGLQTTTPQPILLVGNCTATEYFLGDEVTEYLNTTTITSGNRTTTTTIYSAKYPPTETLGTVSFEDDTTANSTTSFTTTSTSFTVVGFSSEWTVTVCSFGP